MRYFLLIFVCAIVASCGYKGSGNVKKNSAIADTSKPARMEFEEDDKDFGEATMGEKVVLFYTFENVGGKDLLIYDAIPSCGCTMPKFEKTPVKPGEKRTIEVTFDSDSWSGMQRKSITFKTNGLPDYTTITLTGTVN